MMSKPDLNSFSPIHYRPAAAALFEETQPRGILTNKTNTIAANQQYYQQPQPPKIDPPAPPQIPPSATGTTGYKPFRPRSASVQSQKSVGDATDDEKNPANATLREHPRKTIVAFGRTTKVDETIKSIRPITAPYKPPIGSTKDIMDLRKTVENQTVQLQAQHDEIQKLKSTINAQQEKYCYLLDSNSKLWTHLNNLEKKFSAATIDAERDKYNHVMAKEVGKENIVQSVVAEKSVPKDSFIVKKYKEKPAETISEKPSSKKNSEKEERQLVPAQNTIKLAPEIDAISAVQRFLSANPTRAKEIEKLAKGVLKKKQNDSEDEEDSEDDTSERQRRNAEHKKSGHHHHKNNSVVEKITLERKIYKTNNIRDYLESTIDDTLEKFGIGASNIHERKQQHQHHHRNRRPSPTTPTIHEVTSSASSSENDDFEEPPFQRDDSIRRRRKTSVDATAMQDKFDDDMMSSDTETPPPRRNERRQRVADRLNGRRH